MSPSNNELICMHVQSGRLEIDQDLYMFSQACTSIPINQDISRSLSTAVQSAATARATLFVQTPYIYICFVWFPASRSLVAERYPDHINSWFPGRSRWALPACLLLGLETTGSDQTDVTSGHGPSIAFITAATSEVAVSGRKTPHVGVCLPSHGIRSASSSRGRPPHAAGRSGADKAGSGGAHGAVQLSGLRRSGGARGRPS